MVQQLGAVIGIEAKRARTGRWSVFLSMLCQHWEKHGPAAHGLPAAEAGWCRALASAGIRPPSARPGLAALHEAYTTDPGEIQVNLGSYAAWSTPSWPRRCDGTPRHGTARYGTALYMIPTWSWNVKKAWKSGKSKNLLKFREQS